MDSEFDFVVVGSGSAGGIVAARLSASGRHRVLLLEAGPDDRSIWTRIPLGAARILAEGRLIRKYFTQPDAIMHGRQLYWPRGWMLGGSSAVNGMIWVHGNPQEYDTWAAQGCDGWSHASLLPYFKRVESYACGDAALRGRSGPIHITEYNPRDELTDAFLNGAESAGLTRRVDDYNATGCEGAGYVQFNEFKGRRWAVREGYLDPARKRRNLVIQCGAFAHRIVFDRLRAVGVEYEVDGRTARVRAAREVILCAGAYGTPQLLELSGIGRDEVLSQHGIPLCHELPGVGENLSEHVYTGLCYRARPGTGWNSRLGTPWRAALEGAKYLATRNGPMTTVSITGQAFIRDGGERSELKLQLRQVTTDGTRNAQTMKISDDDAFEVGTLVIRPQSRGSCHIQSRDPRCDPRLVSNHFTSEYDRHAALLALKAAHKVVASGPMAQFQPRPLLDDLTDSSLLEHIFASGATAYHPVGTCRMGQDEGAVCAPDLKVRGLSGLRIADASVLPSISSTNTNAICMVIGEKAADNILLEHE